MAIKQHPLVTNVTTSGSGSMAVSGGAITPIASEVATLMHPTTRPRILSTNSNGTINLKFPLIVTAITINSIVYNPDANGIVNNVPAADATAYLEFIKYQNIG